MLNMLKTTIDVIIGKSLSGKTTGLKEILTTIKIINEVNPNSVKITRLKTTTTRPKRKEDKINPQYYFIDKQTLQNSNLDNIIAERTYDVIQNNQPTQWSYFIDRQKLINDINKYQRVLLILDWKGFNDLHTAISADHLLNQHYQIQGWYLNIPLKIRLQRLTDINSPRHSDDPKESLRRLYYDEFVDFKDLDQDIKKHQTIDHLKVFNNNNDFIKYYTENCIIERKN